MPSHCSGQGGKPLCEDPVEGWITVPEAGYGSSLLPAFPGVRDHPQELVYGYCAFLVLAAYSYFRGEV